MFDVVKFNQKANNVKYFYILYVFKPNIKKKLYYKNKLISNISNSFKNIYVSYNRIAALDVSYYPHYVYTNNKYKNLMPLLQFIKSDTHFNLSEFNTKIKNKKNYYKFFLNILNNDFIFFDLLLHEYGSIEHSITDLTTYDIECCDNPKLRNSLKTCLYNSLHDFNDILNVKYNNIFNKYIIYDTPKSTRYIKLN